MLGKVSFKGLLLSYKMNYILSLFIFWLLYTHTHTHIYIYTNKEIVYLQPGLEESSSNPLRDK
jgi:hypothetical protein